MAHIKHAAERADATDPRWLKRGAEISGLANEWSGRDDLVAYLGPGAGGPAPACYSPALAEIEVNVDVAFAPGIDPELVGDLTERRNQYTWPKAIGAIKHEAFHAKHSHWDMQAAYDALSSPKAYEALILLEEGRIEARGVSADPSAIVFLRACVMDLVIADAMESFASESTIRGTAKLMGLIQPRLRVGILDYEDVSGLVEKIEGILGAELFGALDALIASAQAHTLDSNVEALYPVAEDWARLVDEASKEAGEPQAGEGEGSGAGTPGGSGEGAGIPKVLQDLLEEMQDAAETVDIVNGDALADQEEAEKWAEIVRERAEQAQERGKNSKVAVRVFERPAEGGGKSGSTLHTRRAPTSSERAAAVTVAHQLEKAKYRDRDITEVRSEVPPGRLHTRAMVQAAAQRAQGRMVQAEPWQRKVRRQTDEPSLTIGVMVDISGSMGGAMEPMGATAWVMSEAGRRIQARTAMVYYGSSVFPTLRPGQHLKDVHIYTAPDGTEKFDEAFRALDGSLNLLYGSGARLLVIVSDGCYTSEESNHAKRWVRRCAEMGVGVLWLPFDDGHYAAHLTKKSPTVSIVPGFLDPAAAAMQIGKAAADAMTAVGRLAA